ncbi:hypothetical protein ACF3NG_02855 [Aerococcaceae bacterium WGS1372]
MKNHDVYANSMTIDVFPDMITEVKPFIAGMQDYLTLTINKFTFFSHCVGSKG